METNEKAGSKWMAGD